MPPTRAAVTGSVPPARATSGHQPASFPAGPVRPAGPEGHRTTGEGA